MWEYINVQTDCYILIHMFYINFQCKSGTIPCIISAWKCDGDEDCGDGSDEENCSKDEEKCGNAEFQCTSSKECIPRVLLCSGKAECKDESDEANCTSKQMECDLAQGQLKCDETRSDSPCFTLSQICDGQQDCVSNRDESTEFCGTSKCLHIMFLCFTTMYSI